MQEWWQLEGIFPNKREGRKVENKVLLVCLQGERTRVDFLSVDREINTGFSYFTNEVSL